MKEDFLGFLFFCIVFAVSFASSDEPTPHDPINLVVFTASQIFNGISPIDYGAHQALYDKVLQETIAQCMKGVAPKNVQNLVIDREATAPSLTTSLRGKREHQSVDSLALSYLISVENSLSYSILTGQLTSAVENGQFTKYLANNSPHEIPKLTSGIVSIVPTDQQVTISPTSSDDFEFVYQGDSGSGDEPSDGLIAGLVLTCLISAAVLLVSITVYRRLVRIEREGAASCGTTAHSTTPATRPAITFKKRATLIAERYGVTRVTSTLTPWDNPIRKESASVKEKKLSQEKTQKDMDRRDALTARMQVFGQFQRGSSSQRDSDGTNIEMASPLANRSRLPPRDTASSIDSSECNSPDGDKPMPTVMRRQSSSRRSSFSRRTPNPPPLPPTPPETPTTSEERPSHGWSEYDDPFEGAEAKGVTIESPLRPSMDMGSRPPPLL